MVLWLTSLKRYPSSKLRYRYHPRRRLSAAGLSGLFAAGLVAAELFFDGDGVGQR